MGCEFCDKKSNIQDKYIDDSICTIRNNKGLYSLGFFCNIQTKHVLITNDDILYEKIDGNDIKIILYKNEKVIDLIIENSRIYTNINNGIKIIEIKETDNLYTNSFFGIENNINNLNEGNLFLISNKNREIILNTIKYEKEDDDNKFEYKIEINPSLNNPIIIKKANNVYNIIGLHKEIINGKYKGQYIKGLIEEYLKFNNKNKSFIKFSNNYKKRE